MTWLNKFCGLQSSDRVLLKSPFSFDGFGCEYFAPYAAGGALVVAAPRRNWDVGYLLQTIRDYQVTIILVVPSFLRVMVEDPRFENCEFMRWLFVGGEALPADLIRRVKARIATPVVNLYGPAEACIDTIACKFLTSEIPDHTPIGLPIANTQAYILGDDLRMVPVGEVGELFLAGDSLGMGYHARPELTAERFLPNPFGPAGSRMYRTGDLVRYLTDGEIEYLERADFQVKVRGFRLELGEIENRIHSHPAVRQAVVMVHTKPGSAMSSAGGRLTAYLEVRDGFALSSDDLRSYLSNHLPDYMVPADFIFLESLPVSRSGKVDRLELARHGEQIGREVSNYTAPRNPIENTLVEIWSEVLGISSVGVFDNFLNLGGHSLALAQVQTRIYERYKVDLPIYDVFKVPDIAWMAEQIEKHLQKGDISELPRIQPADRDHPIPLSYSQEQVWFLHSIEPESLAYNYQITIRLIGSLDIEILERTLSEIVRRHEIFRTTFEPQAGDPVQVIHPAWKAEIPVVDLSGFDPVEQREQLEALFEKYFEQKFLLDRLPLINWKVIRFSDEEHLLVHLEHHLVHDGWSFGLLMQELKVIYSAFVVGDASPLPELEFQFADYAVWQRKMMAGAYKDRRMEYWKNALKDPPPRLELPADRPPPMHKNYRGESLQRKLDGQFYNQIKSFSLRERVTLFTTFTAAFKALLVRYTGQNDILIGSGFANRRLKETEAMIGMFVNTVALRSFISAEMDFYEVLGEVHRTISEALIHQDLPFKLLVEELQPQRSMAENPFFEVLFSFHDSPIPELEFPNLKGSLEFRQNKAAKFDLNIVVIPRAEQLHQLQTQSDQREVIIVWEFNADLFDRMTMERMLDHYLTLLQSWVTDPSQRIRDIQFLSHKERVLLLEDWNQTKRDYPRDSAIQDLFSRQAEMHPRLR